MSGQLWSWLLAAIGIGGIFLAGRKARPWIGWSVGVTAQALWIAYALATRQYGFLASALGYATVYALNVRRALAARRADGDCRRCAGAGCIACSARALAAGLALDRPGNIVRLAGDDRPWRVLTWNYQAGLTTPGVLTVDLAVADDPLNVPDWEPAP